jgi:dTDP-4-amino-4,6-dideoxygalactose transaminase
MGFGTNSRLDELQAAILLAKLPGLRAWTERRSAIADTYRQALEGRALRPLGVDPRCVHAHHLFVVLARERDAVREQLLSHGVETLIHYPDPIHKLPAYRGTVRRPVPLDRAEILATQVLSIPLYPQMTDAEVDAVATALSRC